MKKSFEFVTALEDLFFLAAVLVSLAAGGAAFVATSHAYGVVTQPASVSATLECSPDAPAAGARG